MKAIVVDGDDLVWRDVVDPDLGDGPGVGQVQIRVHATAINRADLVQRSGGYPPPPGASAILGLECAGEVLAVGDSVSRVQPGDAVCALLSGGGYAEQVVVPAGQVLPIPDGLDMEQAAAIPEVFATAYLNLYMEAGLTRGEHVVLHAGASGVGTAGIQLCNATNNPCFVTAGSADKIDRCIALGAEAGWDRNEGSFLPAVTQWRDGGGVDVVLDPVGAAYFTDNLNCLNLEGRLVLIGLMSGVDAQLNMGVLMMKRLRVIGSTLRARSVAAKAAVMDELKTNVWPHLGNGTIKPIIEEVIPIAEAARAHELVAGNQTFGKVVLKV
ncbi:MAG: NAD(P)H-quinone oxidoreductase [Gammaproteobacteria bacterium]|nr:NAD(P)H-quinone oxidoreductase [Gammaproteobacteria bacterium]